MMYSSVSLTGCPLGKIIPCVASKFEGLLATLGIYSLHFALKCLFTLALTVTTVNKQVLYTVKATSTESLQYLPKVELSSL